MVYVLHPKCFVDSIAWIGLHYATHEVHSAAQMGDTFCCTDGGYNFSLCGPDGTKVGTDLGLTVGMVMFRHNRKVAVAPPQVIWAS